jgi:hypothetical protein
MVPRPLWPCAVLLVVGAFALLLGGLALYGRHTVLDERAFAARAMGTLRQDEVRDEVVARVADREIAAHHDLAARRPLLEAAIADVVAGPDFPGEFAAGIGGMHRALFTDDQRPVRFGLPGAGAELQAAAAARSAALRRTVPPEDPELMTLGGGRLETALRDLAPVGRRLAGLAPLALAVGALLLLAAVLRAPTRRRGLRRAALAVAAAGGVLLAATAIARALVLATFDTSHGDAVVGTIWSAYLADLRLWSLLVGAVALILAAAAEPGPRGAWRRVARRATVPAGRGARLARAGLLALLGVLLLTAPEVPLDLALVAGAGILVFSAAAEVVRVTTH